MGAKQFEAHLYYKFKLVGLRPTDRVRLFDLMVRVRGGIFGSGTCILNLGSFLDFNRPCPTPTDADDYPDAEDYAAYAADIEQGLRMLKARECDNLPEDGIFGVHQDQSVHQERISTGAGLSAKILQFITAGCNTRADMLCTISKLSYHAIKDFAINDLFVGDEPAGPEAAPPLWKPDVRKISRACDPREGADGTSLELWIVREVVFCEELTFEDVQQVSANAAMAMDGTMKAVETQANRRAAVNRHNLGIHQLGFKAIRLFYNEDGDLLRWRPDTGDSVPALRNHSGESCHDRYQDYHLGGFFDVEPPSTHGTKSAVANVPLDLLDIQTLVTEETL